MHYLIFDKISQCSHSCTVHCSVGGYHGERLHLQVTHSSGSRSCGSRSPMISLLLAPQSGAHRRDAYRDSDQLIAFEHLGERNDYVKLIGYTGYTFLSSYFGHLLSLSKKLLYWHCSFSTRDCQDFYPSQLKGNFTLLMSPWDWVFQNQMGLKGKVKYICAREQL